eukprot:4420262-Ditylum_brightwellii.AAC.1
MAPSKQDCMGDFVTLGCNTNLTSATCVPWSLMGFDMDNVRTINCNICVDVDVLILDIMGSTAIIGHLKFPENFYCTLMTQFMAVQGKLTMSSTKP